ncbi:MAG: CoA transferase, partial [Dehalococcoidia bacterium]|nr:CoA transferase [Dehalococcoidia bacterium]
MSDEQPFAGIRVIEFGQFVAVPFCSQLFAQGGAEVIKVESLEGDPVRQLGQLVEGETRIFLSRNRGKHSLPLALRHPAAADVIDRLLGNA